jgi:hypothetical protein
MSIYRSARLLPLSQLAMLVEETCSNALRLAAMVSVDGICWVADSLALSHVPMGL